jgi:glycerophosphoryl diester phosphodiesterase
MTLNIAHRGYSGKYPENTMLAFEKAHQVGADGIELDVHFSKDGQLIVMHDEDVSRTTNGTGLIIDKTLEELKQLDASATFTGQYGINQIPTLEEYCAWVKPTGMITNIELKTSILPYPGIEKAVLAMIDKYDLRKKIIISSFNHYSVMRFKQLAPDVLSGFLESSEIVDFGAYTERLGIACIHPLIYNISMNPDVLAEIQAHKRLLNVWHVDTEDDVRAMKKIGVNAVISNYPEMVKKVLAE